MSSFIILAAGQAAPVVFPVAAHSPSDPRLMAAQVQEVCHG